jgi:hypothetical protein
MRHSNETSRPAVLISGRFVVSPHEGEADVPLGRFSY